MKTVHAIFGASGIGLIQLADQIDPTQVESIARLIMQGIILITTLWAQWRALRKKQ